MGEILRFPNAPEPEDEAAAEPCPELIRQLERALDLARNGALLSFIMVFEKPERCTGALQHTCCTADLKQLLAALAIEQHDLAAYISMNVARELVPPDGAT